MKGIVKKENYKIGGELSTFSSEEFGRVRVILRDGEPWFVASDVAVALGYANPSAAVNAHCKKSIKSTDNVIREDGKTMPPVTINLIPESDLYRLIMRSNLPAADKFQDWVVEDVLPSIRKTGSYSVQQKQLPRDYVEALRALLAAEEEKLALQEANAELTEQNTELRESLGCATDWKQVMAIDWLDEYFDLKKEGAYQQIGKALSSLSRARGVEIRRARSSKYPQGSRGISCERY